MTEIPVSLRTDIGLFPACNVCVYSMFHRYANGFRFRDVDLLPIDPDALNDFGANSKFEFRGQIPIPPSGNH